jgi:hypothetical protein
MTASGRGVALGRQRLYRGGRPLRWALPLAKRRLKASGPETGEEACRALKF